MLALCLALGAAALADTQPLPPEAPPAFMPGAPQESPALKALRKDLFQEEAKVEALRIREKRLMAESAEKEAAQAQAQGQAERAGFLREQAKAFRQEADLQAQRAGLQQLRQAWQAGDTGTAMGLMQRGRQLEEQAQAQRLSLGLSLHESMLGQLQERVKDDLKALGQGKLAGKAPERVAAGQQALALIAELIKDTRAIRKAEAADDAQALAKLLRASEKRKAGLFPLLMKLKGQAKLPNGMPLPGDLPPGGLGGPGEGLMPPPDGFMLPGPGGGRGPDPMGLDPRPMEGR
jgi:hypothetical protein